MGKSTTAHPIVELMVVITSWPQRMGVVEHLRKLVRRPEASPNTRNSSRIVASSELVGWQKITTSLANSDMLDAACGW